MYTYVTTLKQYMEPVLTVTCVEKSFLYKDHPKIP